MVQVSEPDFVAGTLEWCNEMRNLRNLPPLNRLPKGKRKDGWSCPCGTATGMYVGYTCYGDSVNATGALPLCVEEFVIAFDNGDLPQYNEFADAL